MLALQDLETSSQNGLPAFFEIYNTINFDEKFLRHTFINLLPVYQTQNFGNGRLIY